MKKNENKYYIDKGIYSHGQVGGYLTLKQYILVEQEGKRCLLLRFVNDADFVINAARLVIKQLNADGEEIGRVDIKYTDMELAAGGMYSPEQGIVVKKNCVDFTVQMVYLISGDYKYVYKNGIVTAHYDKRGYIENDKKGKKRGSATLSVRQKYKGGGRFFGFIAFVSLALVILSAVYLFFGGENIADSGLPNETATVYTSEFRN